MSKKLVWMQRCAAVLPLLIAVSASYGQVVFTDDFSSYTAPDLTAPWADWSTGDNTVPVPGVAIVAAGATLDPLGSSQVLQHNGGEPVAWITNPFTGLDQIVNFNFSIRGTAGNYVFGIDAGTSGITPYSGSPTGQYSAGVGIYTGFGGGGAPNGGVVVGAQSIGTGLIMDGTTWNTVNLELIQRSAAGAPVFGQMQLTLNGVNTGTYSDFSMGAAGMDVIDLNSWTSIAGAEMGHISVTQNGFAAPLPSNFPATYETMLPTSKGVSGGITTNGRYVYVNSGPGAGVANQLYRYDTLADTWTTLAAMPATFVDAGSTTRSAGYTPHGLSVDGGKIVMLAGPPPNGFPNGCNAFIYDVATDTWTPTPVLGNGDPGNTGATYENIHVQESGGGYTYGITNISQGGATVFSLAGNVFPSSQTSATMAFTPYGNPHVGDMAYVPASGGTPAYLYQIGTNDGTSGMGRLTRYDPVANTTTDMAELPVAVPGGDFTVNNSLAYVDSMFANLLILHKGNAGQAGIYDVRVEGGGLFAVMNGSDAIYRYDIATDTWATLSETLGFTIAGGDDINAGLLFVGDTDRDLDIDAADLAKIGLNWDPTGTGHTWAQGDFDGDGDVDASDLAKIGLYWNPIGTSGVPEPTTICLMGLGVLGVLRRRRK